MIQESQNEKNKQIKRSQTFISTISLIQIILSMVYLLNYPKFARISLFFGISGLVGVCWKSKILLLFYLGFHLVFFGMISIHFIFYSPLFRKNVLSQSDQLYGLFVLVSLIFVFFLNLQHCYKLLRLGFVRNSPIPLQIPNSDDFVFLNQNFQPSHLTRNSTHSTFDV
ncbi:hypothetical protein M0811_04858 [Anaeramoeba ignava]|uniref:Transmembrane protein n=1 Tax=Anaeramoeba ignava TaxID=1746090 RepID=A0A9Q0LW53_ANAIG|nr:hypothetical protein M0811_04858 [Anaeramoeba ignava]